MNQEYMKKFVTPEEAAKAVKSGDWVDFGFGTGFPELFDRALAGRAGELSDVKVRGGLVYAPKIEILEADPGHKAFTWYSWHIGAYERKKQAEGQIRDAGHGGEKDPVLQGDVSDPHSFFSSASSSVSPRKRTR